LEEAIGLLGGTLFDAIGGKVFLEQKHNGNSWVAVSQQEKDQFQAKRDGNGVYRGYFDENGNPLEVTYNNSKNGMIVVYDAGHQPIALSWADAYVPATGKRYATGTEYVDDQQRPNGVDTVPAMLSKGERIITVAHNASLKGISNAELVRRNALFEQYMAAGMLSQDGRLTAAAGAFSPSQGVAQGLAALALQQQGGTSWSGMSQLLGEVKGLRDSFDNKSLVNINMDEGGIVKYIESVGQISRDYSAKMKR
jgi:hypothetical protein